MNDKQIIEAHEAYIEEQGNLISQQASAFSRFFENLRSLGVDDSILYKSMRGIKAPPQWSKEWPTEPGWYWFMLKGWMELRLGRCHIEEDTPYFIYRGQPIAKQEGVWTPAILPDTAGAVALLEGEE